VADGPGLKRSSVQLTDSMDLNHSIRPGDVILCERYLAE
jgi:hypothetical protein